MWSRWRSITLVSGVSALLLSCLSASPTLAAGSPVTYTGTTATGGTVEFDLSADGATVTRFAAAEIPMTCGLTFDGAAEGVFPVLGGVFSNGSPQTGVVFGGAIHGAHLATGTASYRIVNVRYDGCTSMTVGWTASAQRLLPVPQGDEGRPAASLRPRILVSYRQLGGIAGEGPSLVVSKNRWARVALGRCVARLKLRPRGWRQLRAGLRKARIRAIAGDYPPPPGAADALTYVIKTHAGTVRIALPAQSAGEETMRKLEPLLKALNRTVAAGERRFAPPCRAVGNAHADAPATA